MIQGGMSRLSVTINGTVFPILTMPGMQCLITTNVKQTLPFVRLVLNDPISVINNTLPIVDGTPFNVILDDTTTASPTGTNFRSIGTPKRMPMPGQPTMTAYVINGLLDSIPLIRSNPNTVLTGTSNTVMQNIASQNRLSFKTNVSGNDAMTWLPGKKTWAGFIEHISSHSYVDANAVMSWGIDEAKTLHFNNITTLVTANPVAYIYYGAPTNTSYSGNNSFVAMQYKALNRSTLFNSMGGYGQRSVQPSLNGNVSKYLDSNATVTNNSLDINTNISAAVQPVSRMHLAAADAGNSHANYVQARHQNYRLKSTYCQNVYVLLYQKSNLNIFDTVAFTASTDASSSSSLVNGTYIVTAISRVFWSYRYYEKIELTSAGPITQSNSGLLS